MTAWALRFSRAARKGFDAIPDPADRAALADRPQRLARNEPGIDIKKLTGLGERYRVR